jgi:hypothetical protein
MMERPPPPNLPEQATRSPDQLREGIERLQRQIGELEAFDPSSIAVRDAAETKAMQADIAETLAKTFGKESPDYKRYASAARLDHAPNYISGRPPAALVVGWVQDGKAKSLALLHQAVKQFQEEFAALGETATVQPVPSSEVTGNEPSRAEGEGEQKPKTTALQPDAAPGETAIAQPALSSEVTRNEPSRAEGEGEQKPKTTALQPDAAPGETAIAQPAPSGEVIRNEPSRAEGKGEQKAKTKARQPKKKELPGS